MTMFQSRDWEILQETIFHVAVSIKSNIGKKNNFASVLFLLFLDYKQSIWIWTILNSFANPLAV